MIRESFVLLPKVRERTEQKFWSQGVNSWNDFLASSKIKGLGKARKACCDGLVREANKHLRQDDALFFADAFRQSDHWRLYDQFKDDAVYLDIETNGYYGGITVVGLSDGIETMTFVRGFNLDKIRVMRELSKYKLLVTFNGVSFDVPVMRRFFGSFPKMPHVDLRFVCQKAGYTGGLKVIEKRLGISRHDEVVGVTGSDAVDLWYLWRATGEREYLKKLVAYNEEDILNLKPIAKRVIPELWEKVRSI